MILLLLLVVSVAAQECQDRAGVREKLPYPPKGLEYAKPFPRVHIDDIHAKENDDYLHRRKPFVLTHAADDWAAKSNDFLPSVVKKFPNAVVDFYPFNMLASTNPYLFRLASAYDEFLKEPGQGRFGEAERRRANGNPGKYLHMQLTTKYWDNLAVAARAWHPWFQTDEWMNQCLKETLLMDEYLLKTHWKMILAGQPGAGMFNHTDHLLTGSWHAHLQGLKWWYVCKDGQCYEDLFHPGDTLFYPQLWHHQTQNIDMPTVTVTGTVVDAENYKSVTTRLFNECVRPGGFRFSGKLCDVLDRCARLWHDEWGTGRYGRKKWRTMATKPVQKERDGPSSLGNNYDGRNTINE
jgi:hypothetical protein